MFHKSSDSKSDSDRLCPQFEASASNNYNERITLPSTSRHQQSQERNNYPSGSNNLTEEVKSQNRFRNKNFHSLSQNPQSHSSQDQLQSNGNHKNISNHNQTLTNQRCGQSNLTRSTTNPQLYQAQSQLNHHNPQSSSSKLAFNGVESQMLAGLGQARWHRPASTSLSTATAVSNFRDEHKSTHNISRHHNQQQHERDTEEVVTMIKEELENDTDRFNETELENLGSFEQNLPIELSFLIRQQAYCMARMNYLDRQIRELKETRQATPTTSTPINHYNHQNTTNNRNHTNNNIVASAASHSKNGNFIPSDDSGGEYSRATISDDDELSSLLDQIAKSVRPEQRNIVNQQNLSINQLQHQQQRANYSVITNQPHNQQQYAIINPNQLHHQAVPVFVMSSPIAVAAAHPTSISSNVLPGVHFQPEPRYNQYYEDSYVQNKSSASTIHRHNGIRSQSHFDTSISAIEQLMSQKEKRQIRSQLKSSDNWLKMQSNLSNLNEAFTSTSNINSNNGNNGTVMNPADVRDIGGSLSNERNLPPSSSAATENSKSVIESGGKIS